MTVVTSERPLQALPRVGAARSTLADEFLAFFTLVLGGYAIGSKGFAYLGIAPIYIGELSLLFGVIALWYTHSIRHLLREPLIRLLIVFMLFGAVRTIPYLPTYRLDALRDGVLWGYGLFAIVIAGVVVSKPHRLSYLIDRYRRFLPIFLVAAPVIWLTTALADNIALWTGVPVPTWPGTNVPILLAKAGDLLVHLGGAAAFMAVGLSGEAKKSRIAFLVLGVALTALSRGGLLAFSSAFLVAFASRPRGRSAWTIAAIFISAIVILAVTDLRVRFPGSEREVSFDQLTARVASAAGTSGDDNLEGTKVWRLIWWAKIVDYTIGGEYRWLGKGYGINIALDDGMIANPEEDDSLRSAHNVTMTVLARSGVIGLALWLALLGTWFGTLLRAMRDAKHRNDREWYALFAFLLAYLLALFVNGTFDVYIEGPAGGIWFWSVLGCGIAAHVIYRTADRMAEPGHTLLDTSAARPT
jgi:O-Antigen ligase